MRAAANTIAVLLILIVIGRVLSERGIDVLPTPIPSPKPGSWVVLVEETAERTSDVAKFMADGAWLESLKARQLKFRAYDDDQPEAATYVPVAKAAGIPAVVIASPEGKVLSSFAFPAGRDVLDRRIKEATGL